MSVVLHAQESCYKDFLKTHTTCITFSVVKKKKVNTGLANKVKIISISSIFFPITEKLLQFEYVSIRNILNIFPSRCSCKHVQGTVAQWAKGRGGNMLRRNKGTSRMVPLGCYITSVNSVMNSKRATTEFHGSVYSPLSSHDSD